MAVSLAFASVCPHGEPVHVADTRLAGRYRTFAHTHDFFEVMVVRRGVVRHRVNDQQVDLAAGALTLVRPQDEHCFQNAAVHADSLFTNVAFPRATYERVAAALPLALLRLPASLPPVLPCLSAPRQALLDGHIASLRAGDPAGRAEQELLLCELLASVLAALVMAQRPSAQAPGDAPGWLQSAMLAMRQRENFTAGLPRFLRLCGCSQEHATRCMRRCCDTTPTAFVNRLRLAEAGRLLRDTDRRVLPILIECGFGNTSHFLALFRKQYGCTPRDYRRRHRLVTDPAGIADVKA